MFNRFNWHAIQVFVISYIAYVVLNVTWFSFLMKDFYLKKFAGVLNASNVELGTYFKIFSNPHLLILLAWVLVVGGIIWYALPYSKSNYQYFFTPYRVHYLVSEEIYSLIHPENVVPGIPRSLVLPFLYRLFEPIFKIISF